MHIRTIWWVNRRAEWSSLFICLNLWTHSPVNSISTLSKVCLCVSQDHAYPADELMPLTCRGRVRGLEPSRGDIDDALGKWVAGCLCYDHSSPRRFTYLAALELVRKFCLFVSLFINCYDFPLKGFRWPSSILWTLWWWVGFVCIWCLFV